MHRGTTGWYHLTTTLRQRHMQNRRTQQTKRQICPNQRIPKTTRDNTNNTPSECSEFEASHTHTQTHTIDIAYPACSRTPQRHAWPQRMRQLYEVVCIRSCPWRCNQPPQDIVSSEEKGDESWRVSTNAIHQQLAQAPRNTYKLSMRKDPYVAQLLSPRPAQEVITRICTHSVC